MAAKVFHFTGHADVADINTAYQNLGPLLGGGAALIFGISLFALGISTCTSGRWQAGRDAGIVGFRIPVWLPVAQPCWQSPLDLTRTLIISQVVLSFTLPIPVITLI